MKRYIAALGMSLGVTFGLFFIMQLLVSGNDEVKLDDDGGFKFIDFSQNIQEQDVKIEEVEVEKPPEVEQAPEIEMDMPELDGPSGLDLRMTGNNIDSSIAREGLNLGLSSDGEFLPLVRVPPRYPPRAAERGIEGWVLVEHTVGPEGLVTDAFVIESEPPKIFDRAAVQSVMKYKYKPRIVNGEPATVEGVQIIVRFEMAKDGRGGRR